ncbi:MAG: DUF6496 domain-containing protein [Dongiaceae bacterium]
MPRQPSRGQKQTVGRVMHEFKHGELKTARGKRKVKSRKQAIAIALHEAGASRSESRRKNEANLRRTKAKERRGETARDEAEGRKSRRPAAAGRRKTAGGKATASRTATAGRKATASRKTAGPKTAARKTAGRKTASRKTTARKPAAASRRKAPARGRGGAGEKTRAELYAQASRRNIPGRSRMSKAQLARALAR